MWPEIGGCWRAATADGVPALGVRCTAPVYRLNESCVMWLWQTLYVISIILQYASFQVDGSDGISGIEAPGLRE